MKLHTKLQGSFLFTVIFCEVLYKRLPNIIFLKKGRLSSTSFQLTLEKEKKKAQSKASWLKLCCQFSVFSKQKAYTRISLRTSMKTMWRLCKVAPQSRKALIFSFCTYLILELCSLQWSLPWKNCKAHFYTFQSKFTITHERNAPLETAWQQQFGVLFYL